MGKVVAKVFAGAGRQAGSQAREVWRFGTGRQLVAVLAFFDQKLRSTVE